MGVNMKQLYLRIYYAMNLKAAFLSGSLIDMYQILQCPILKAGFPRK
jgi:hypothetical protein